jgi:hypothetical protein
MGTHIINIREVELVDWVNLPLLYNSMSLVNLIITYKKQRNQHKQSIFLGGVVSLSLLVSNTTRHYHIRGQVMLLWWLWFVDGRPVERGAI